jgi:pilus assembly protein CpaB
MAAALAVICGLAAFLLVRGYVERVQALSPGDPVAVVMATEPLSRGEKLQQGSLGLRVMPQSFAPPGALHSVADASHLVALTDVAAGEVLTRTRVGPAAGPIATLVPEGMSAFPLQTTLPAGSVAPGDLVDVIAVFGGQDPHSDTVGEGLKIAAIRGADRSVSSLSVGGSDPDETLFVLVYPWQAEELAAAQAVGHLAVAVAGPDAPTPTPTQGEPASSPEPGGLTERTATPSSPPSTTP